MHNRLIAKNLLFLYFKIYSDEGKYVKTGGIIQQSN